MQFSGWRSGVRPLRFGGPHLLSNMAKRLMLEFRSLPRWLSSVAALLVALVLSGFLPQPIASAAYEAPNPVYSPGAYYDLISGTGATLQTNLRSLITTGGFLQPRYEDVRFLLDDTDKDPNNASN